VVPATIKSVKARELSLETATKLADLEDKVKPLDGRIKANVKKVTTIENVVN
jgi:hypothetical protein